MKTEIDIIIEAIDAGRTVPEMTAEVQTVYLLDMDGPDIAAWLTHQDGSENWSAYIEASLDPDDPLISGEAYEVALAEVYDADGDLKSCRLVYSLDPPIDRTL